MRELQASLTKAPDVTNKALRDLVRDGAAMINNKAKAYAPVDEGQLRASIHTEGPTGTGATVQAKVGTNVKHAKWQEFGTGIYGPNRTPIRPKIDESEPKWREAQAKTLESIIGGIK